MEVYNLIWNALSLYHWYHITLLDPPARTSFRVAAVTQPSQMGNFKHQSLRSTDRNDRDKEGEKERERDIRDKEGQERLRNVCWHILPFLTSTHRISPSYPTSMTATALLFLLTQQILEPRRERWHPISMLPNQGLALEMAHSILLHVVSSQEKAARKKL